MTDESFDGDHAEPVNGWYDERPAAETLRHQLKQWVDRLRWVDDRTAALVLLAVSLRQAAGVAIDIDFLTLPFRSTPGPFFPGYPNYVKALNAENIAIGLASLVIAAGAIAVLARRRGHMLIVAGLLANLTCVLSQIITISTQTGGGLPERQSVATLAYLAALSVVAYAMRRSADPVAQPDAAG